MQQVAEAAKRILARPVSCKKPLEASLVKKTIRCLEQSSLAYVQVATLLMLDFFGFLCWNDLSHLTVDHLQFADSHPTVFFEQRKNDQFCEGSWVFMACSDLPPCPVALS